jgi:hypothetical protein
MKKIIITLTSIFCFNISTSAQASIIVPVGEEMGIIKHDKATTILAVNIDTKEMESFENKTPAQAIQNLATGIYEMTIYNDNKKSNFIYHKH